jgi:hypothetical protein
MVNDDHRKQMAKCYGEATRILRARHSAEFKAILEDVYSEYGVEVRMRRSSEQILADKLAAAKALLEQHA